MEYLNYATGIIFHPSKTIRELIEDPRRFKVGLFGVLALGILYAATAFVLYARGVSPVTPPFIRLPVETYYLYQVFFNLPVALAGWLLMGSTIYLTIPRPEKTYQDVLGLIGLPYGILVLPFIWLPETLAAIGGASVWYANWWRILTPIRVASGTIWVYLVCAFAVKEFYRLGLTRSLLHTLAGLLAGLSMSLVFIR